MNNIIQMHNQFKTDLEKQAFIEAQTNTILALNQKIKEKDLEIATLKASMVSSPDNLVGDAIISKIIVTPEEALIEDQISIIQQRSFLKELSLEDVKKLDILLKNKNIIKQMKKDIKSESKNMDLTHGELLQLADKINVNNK